MTKMFLSHAQIMDTNLQLRKKVTSQEPHNQDTNQKHQLIHSLLTLGQAFSQPKMIARLMQR